MKLKAMNKQHREQHDMRTISSLTQTMKKEEQHDIITNKQQNSTPS